jgi:hypothetical protein
VFLYHQQHIVCVNKMPESADSEVVQKTTETTGITVANLEQSASTSSAAILSNAVDDDLLSQLMKRIDQAELRVLSLQDSFKDDPVDRVKNDLSRKKVYSSTFVTVAADYYENSLEARAKILNCLVPQLCKSIIFENTAWCKENDIDDPTNSRFYLVLVQYEGKNTHKC